MALVRCSCLVQVVTAADGAPDLLVQVADPTCGYVVHRVGAELDEAARLLD